MSDEEHEFKAYLKTFLEATDKATIDAYLDELRSIPPRVLIKRIKRLSKIQKTDKPKLNRETSDNLFSPFQETERVKIQKVDESKVPSKVESQDLFEPPVVEMVKNMELLKEYFTSIPKHKSKEPSVGGKSKKYRHKNKRRSTRRRR